MLLKKIKNFIKSRRTQAKPVSGRKQASDFLPSNATNLGLVAKILIADLDGRGGSDVAQMLVNVLAKEAELVTFRTNLAIKQPPLKNINDRIIAATNIAQGILSEHRGALIIWGEMEDMGTAMKLRFSAPKGNEESVGFLIAGDALDVTNPIAEKLRPIVPAIIFSILVTSYKGPRRQIASGLKSNLNNLSKVQKSIVEELILEQKISFLIFYGYISLTSGLLGNKKDLLSAEKIFETGLSYVDQKSAPLVWGKIRHCQASLLESKGRLTKNTSDLKFAVIAYQEVAKVYSRKARPHKWSAAWARAALVMYRIGILDHELRESYLKASSEAFEEALAVCDRNAQPAHWAEMMNQFGIVLMGLGEYDLENTTLDKSLRCFREVIKIRTRSAVPLLWAETANNLGAAGIALYKRVDDIELLNEASLCFEGAIDVFSQSPDYAKRTTVIKKNLERVRMILRQGK